MSTAKRFATVSSGIAAATLLLLATPRPAAAADSYKLDLPHSFILFKVKHLGMGFTYGRFRNFTGSFAFDDKSPRAGSVTIEIDATSVYTGDKKRDAHLVSPDFFNAKLYPKITFVSSKVQKSGKAWLVSGNVTLLGQTRPIKTKMTAVGAGKDPWGAYRAGFEGGFLIKRSQFGMGKMIGPAADEVQLILAFEGIKQ